MKVKRLNAIPDERHETGCIVVLTNGTAQHFVGNSQDALRQAAAYCDYHGCKILVISTPQTIYRDMQGGRAALETHKQGGGHGRPEPKLLGAIHRTDLLA